MFTTALDVAQRFGALTGVVGAGLQLALWPAIAAAEDAVIPVGASTAPQSIGSSIPSPSAFAKV